MVLVVDSLSQSLWWQSLLLTFYLSEWQVLEVPYPRAAQLVSYLEPMVGLKCTGEASCLSSPFCPQDSHSSVL